MRTVTRDGMAVSKVRPGVTVWLLLGAPTVLVLGGALYLSWLLWRYVPPHAALFEGLATPLPLEARIAIAASAWFVRLLPYLVLVALGFARVVLVPLARRALDMGHRWAMGAIVAILAVLGVGTCASSALVLYGMHVACSQASADPRFAEELTGLRRTGETVCSAVALP
jgi:hypothetical protein